MSGRKASEVSSLLNRANRARNAFEENIEEILNIFRKNENEYEKIYSNYTSMEIEIISEEAKIELEYEINDLVKRISKTKNIIKNEYFNYIENYENENDELN